MLKINKELSYELLKPYNLSKEFIDEVINANRYRRIENQKYLNIKCESNREIIKRLYQDCHWTFYKIGMLCYVSDKTAKKYCVEYGVENLYTRNCNCYNNYFQNIDSIDKAYFLGLFFADGSVQNKNNHYTFSLIFTYSDKYIIEKFLEYSKFEGKIYTTHKNDKKPRVQLNINSRNVVESLIKLGCVPNKSHADHLDIPILPEHLIPHFIRGYFDGDGIAYSNGNLGFCGHYNMITFIHNYFKDKVSSKTNPYYNESNNIYYLTYGKYASQQIVDIIYENKKDLFLTRKYEKYRPLS